LQRRLKKAGSFAYMMIGCLGVVYGDLATSPLYTYTAIYSSEPTEIDILGVLSLIIYSVISIVTIKYVIFILALDNDGEGGVFALAALIPEWKSGPTASAKIKYVIKRICVYTSIICASFVLGDSVITPPISVLSALEGIGVSMNMFSLFTTL
jgi:KUP system potassium uptake protein